MGVDDHMRGSRFEAQRRRLMTEQILHKLLEYKTALGDLLRALELQLAVILRKHRVAGWLQEEDRRIVHVLAEQRQIVLSQPRCFLEVPLAERAPPAALATRGQFPP